MNQSIQFPSTGPLSLKTIYESFNLQGGTVIPLPVSMSSFIGKTLYNADGSTYTVPAGQLSISYFYSRYFLSPGPVSVFYGGATAVLPTLPVGSGIPLRFKLSLVGGGGSGGGAGGGYSCAGDQRVGGGGGGGSSGVIFETTIPYIGSLFSNVVYGIGGQSQGGGGGSGCPPFLGTARASDGTYGQNGTATSIQYNGTVYSAAGGLGGQNGTPAGFNNSSYNGSPGVGGASSGNNSIAGSGGGSGYIQNSGSGGQTPLNIFNNYGNGGKGGQGSIGGGGSSDAGNLGAIVITWYFV